jgi:hypothetical protein
MSRTHFVNMRGSDSLTVTSIKFQLVMQKNKIRLHYETRFPGTCTQYKIKNVYLDFLRDYLDVFIFPRSVWSKLN